MLGLSRGDSVLVLGRDSEQTGWLLAPWVREVYSAAGDAVPQAGRSLDWIVVNGRLPGDGNCPARLASLLPALKPGGRVIVTFENRWGLGGRRGAQQRGTSVDPAGVACRGLRHALDFMASAGLGELACYAVLPNRIEARTMIPLEPPCPPAAEKFALNQAWKRATPGRALGRLVLYLLIDVRVLRHFYPNYVLVGRKAC